MTARDTGFVKSACRRVASSSGLRRTTTRRQRASRPTSCSFSCARVIHARLPRRRTGVGSRCSPMACPRSQHHQEFSAEGLRSRCAPRESEGHGDPLRFRGRDSGAREVAFINELIAAHPTASRRALSELLCEAWDWRQANGTLRSQVCRSFMLELHRADLITLPPVRCVVPNPLANRRKRLSTRIPGTRPRGLA
jgi:hypothetical protein